MDRKSDGPILSVIHTVTANGLFTLPDKDSDSNPGTDIHPNNGYSN